jgi:uncharacterized short protein YbdD (DUF466 family)
MKQTKQQRKRKRQWMRNIMRKAAKAWVGVEDADKWLEEVRGNGR